MVRIQLWYVEEGTSEVWHEMDLPIAPFPGLRVCPDNAPWKDGTILTVHEVSYFEGDGGGLVRCHCMPISRGESLDSSD